MLAQPTSSRSTFGFNFAVPVDRKPFKVSPNRGVKRPLHFSMEHAAEATRTARDRCSSELWLIPGCGRASECSSPGAVFSYLNSARCGEWRRRRPRGRPARRARPPLTIVHRYSVKTMLNINGTQRSRGRPPATWCCDVEKDLKAQNIPLLTIQDRMPRRKRTRRPDRKRTWD
ncbi:hypothetical protein EVAR_58759_1 [Eumeta japonica]|uniref:Uncharacterized protein n=1 Tax=Eumeta variegata TaxID=151549 RepID=A0A4C1ZAX8_EUMVA|nr:hypothetical protein EVAR_58759_1 [Eumeta japonica]